MSSQPGLLRRLFGPTSSPGAPSSPALSPTEGALADPSGQQFAALLHAVWLVFAADDALGDHELDHLLQIVDDLTDGEAPLEAVEELFDAYATLYAEIGVPGSVALIADILREPELREGALRLAIGAASMDQKMSEHEERVLMLLASGFGYTARQTQELFNEVEGRLSPR
ncbi:MAG: tellurite resistance TerB family protein [Polyangiaceae bacterium]|jgi:tellurite resistance protein|nr:tellurite resistance TerB family protein [Polyangiaceae bacterium]